MNRCPKCEGTMSGPKWESGLDMLKYWCSCGYYTHKTPADRKKTPLPMRKEADQE